MPLLRLFCSSEGEEGLERGGDGGVWGVEIARMFCCCAVLLLSFLWGAGWKSYEERSGMGTPF